VRGGTNEIWNEIVKIFGCVHERDRNVCNRKREREREEKDLESVIEKTRESKIRFSEIGI